jgi:DHA1 family purine base/nucleoside efflux pump-like MFS transporter
MSSKIEPAPSFLFLIALTFSGFTASIASMLSGLLLIDIGTTFNVAVGVAGQICTGSFLVSIIFALLTSLFSLKFDHKKILQLGIMAYTVAAIGCYLAPNFNFMMVSFSLTGIGYALATTMIFTLTGLFPPERRGEAIGYIIAGMSGSYLVGALVVPYLQGIGGWRYAFIGYLLPSSVLALVVVTFAVPQGSRNVGEVKLSEGFRNIFVNRSAFSSLSGYLLAIVMWQGFLTYNMSFFRDQFLVSIGQASVIILFGASLYTVGSVFSSRLASRLGRKTLVTVSILVASLLFIVYSYLPVFVFSAGVMCVACFLVGLMDASSTSLIIEQVPLYAGIMMSLQRVVTQIGSSIGSGLGGAVLTFSSYNSMFVILGFFGVASALIFYLFTIDAVS